MSDSSEQTTEFGLLPLFSLPFLVALCLERNQNYYHVAQMKQGILTVNLPEIQQLGPLGCR